MPLGGIKVVGLRELRSALRAADARFPKELQQLNKKIVADLIVPRAQQLMGAHAPRAGSAAIGTIRALASGTNAQVAVGKASVPWAVGHEFGSIRYKQFPPHLGRDGYALYPTIRERQPEILDEYVKALGKLLQDAFPN